MKKILISLLLILILLSGLWQLSNSRTFQVTGKLISRVEVTDSLIALTFDDGPTPGFTGEVLEVLLDYDVPATFFVTGSETEQHFNEAIKIVEAGHQLGNHSYSHPQMLLKSPGFIQDEIERTDQAIRQVGYNGEIYFRPPFCKKLFLLPWILHRSNRTSVTWDIEPESLGDVKDDPQKIADHIEERVKPGSIILLHVMYESREPSRKALPIIIHNLEKRGYKFVTLQELIDNGK